MNLDLEWSREKLKCYFDRVIKLMSKIFSLKAS